MFRRRKNYVEYFSCIRLTTVRIINEDLKLIIQELFTTKYKMIDFDTQMKITHLKKIFILLQNKKPSTFFGGIIFAIK